MPLRANSRAVLAPKPLEAPRTRAHRFAREGPSHCVGALARVEWASKGFVSAAKAAAPYTSFGAIIDRLQQRGQAPTLTVALFILPNMVGRSPSTGSG